MGLLYVMCMCNHMFEHRRFKRCVVVHMNVRTLPCPGCGPIIIGCGLIIPPHPTWLHPQPYTSSQQPSISMKVTPSDAIESLIKGTYRHQKSTEPHKYLCTQFVCNGILKPKQNHPALHNKCPLIDSEDNEISEAHCGFILRDTLRLPPPSPVTMGLIG